MTADVGHLPIPQFHRTAAQVVGSAQRLIEQDKFQSILVIGHTPDADLIFLSAGDNEQLTSAEALWMIEMAKLLLLHPERYARME